MANLVVISGNLTKDPELRFTPSGKPVAQFTIAHNTRRQNQQTGQWEDGDACFIDVELWGKKGENFVNEAAQRGKSPVLVLGALKQDSWEDKNGGGKRSKHKINAEEVAFISRGQQQGGGQQSPAQDVWNQAASNGQTAQTGGFSQQPPF